MSATQRKKPEEQLEIPEGTPEFYIDSINVGSQLYGSTMWLGTLREGQPPLVKVVVKISPPMVKVMSLILSKHIRNYEKDIGPITIPKTLYHSLGLEEYI
jgi:hypothetical protein